MGHPAKECRQSGSPFSRSISSANADQLSAMIDCSSDRRFAMILDDARAMHSAAYILHCFALIIAISPNWSAGTQHSQAIDATRCSEQNRSHADSLVNKAHCQNRRLFKQMSGPFLENFATEHQSNSFTGAANGKNRSFVDSDNGAHSNRPALRRDIVRIMRALDHG
jgi:hypothetical protein